MARPGARRPLALAALAVAGAALAAALAGAAAELWLRVRSPGAAEQALRDEVGAHRQLMVPAATPRLGALGWFALRPGARAVSGGVARETNALGFRDAPHPLRPPPGVFRLVVIGDSFVWGQGVADPAALFPRRLGVRRVGGRELEVVLMGYCGANLPVYAAMLEDLALGLDPDAVLVTLGGNDLEDHDRPPPPCLPAAARRLLGATPALRREAERRCNVLTGHYERHLAATFEPGSEQRRRGRQALARMREAAAAHGVDLLAFHFEHRAVAVPAEEAYRALAGELGIPFASLAPAAARLRAAGTPEEELVVSAADPHPGARAHALAAEAVTDLLRRLYPDAD